MVRYFYGWTPLVIVTSVVLLSLPWLALIALFVLALIALPALALALAVVPYVAIRALRHRRHGGAEAPRSAPGLAPAPRPRISWQPSFNSAVAADHRSAAGFFLDVQEDVVLDRSHQPVAYAAQLENEHGSDTRLQNVQVAA